MESLSTVVVENLSGCARTDYRSNHALLERAKFRRKLLNYKRGNLFHFTFWFAIRFLFEKIYYYASMLNR